MNDVYFYCGTCKTYTDAGYRWCYWTLEEPSIVQKRQAVAVDRVMAASDYWKGATEADWLRQVLGFVKQFLEAHKAHDLRYGVYEDFADSSEERPEGTWRQDPPLDPKLKLFLEMRRPFPVRPARFAIYPNKDAKLSDKIHAVLFNTWERCKAAVRWILY